jgi:pimeloyl-ACP methyl ester carboxylesterase
MPPAAQFMNATGVVAEEASWIDVPVFLGFGERDVTCNPWEEPRWYWRARDVTLAVVPRMSHGMNSAQTRAQMWQRLHHWALGVAATTPDERLARHTPEVALDADADV